MFYMYILKSGTKVARFVQAADGSITHELEATLDEDLLFEKWMYLGNIIGMDYKDKVLIVTSDCNEVVRCVIVSMGQLSSVKYTR